jgi:segregation and condensation protein A
MKREEGSEDYRVSLDIYGGPLDLLLYLVYKTEIDIFNIPISEILEQYLAHVEMIKELDIEIAGDFMVLASRLVNIKSKLLMPRPEAEPDEEEVIDPRAELVKELLEYKEYKERAYALELKKLEREKMYERIPDSVKSGLNQEKLPVEMADENVSVWDLLHAFHRITKDFMPETPRKIVYDDTPVSVYVERLIDRVSLTPNHKLAFSEVFTGLDERIQVIGMFLALLEAVKEGALLAYQVQEQGDIYIEFVPESDRLPKDVEQAPGTAPGNTDNQVEKKSEPGNNLKSENAQ